MAPKTQGNEKQPSLFDEIAQTGTTDTKTNNSATPTPPITSGLLSKEDLLALQESATEDGNTAWQDLGYQA